MANWNWDGMLNENEEKLLKDLILYLYEGYSKFGHDKYAEHIFYMSVRDVTRIIGERKNLKISKRAEEILGKCNDFKMVEKAQKENPRLTVNEHKIPAKNFWDEFKNKKAQGKIFSKNDAEHWLDDAEIAIITKEEDEKLTRSGWIKNRPDNAYEILGIELKDVK